MRQILYKKNILPDVFFTYYSFQHFSSADVAFILWNCARIKVRLILQVGYINIIMNLSSVGVENNESQTALAFNLNSSIDTEGSFGRHGFLRANPWTAIPSIAVLSLASLGGTFGNVLTLLSVALCKEVRNVESVFIVNLAISDLYVTAIADPMSIVGK